MAIAPIPSLLPPVRGTGFVPAFTPPAALDPRQAFARIVESAVTTGAPLPAAGLEQAVPRPAVTSLLDQSYVRDLVSGFASATRPSSALELTPAFTTSFGVDGALGRTGLSAALQNLDDRQALALYSAALGLFQSLQALGSADGQDEPSLGSLLDTAA